MTQKIVLKDEASFATQLVEVSITPMHIVINAIRGDEEIASVMIDVYDGKLQAYLYPEHEDYESQDPEIKVLVNRV